MVRQIGSGAETKAVDLRISMDQRDWLKTRAEQFNISLQRAHFDLRQSPKLVVRIEDVPEHVLNECGRVRMGIKR